MFRTDVAEKGLQLSSNFPSPATSQLPLKLQLLQLGANAELSSSCSPKLPTRTLCDHRGTGTPHLAGGVCKFGEQRGLRVAAAGSGARAARPLTVAFRPLRCAGTEPRLSSEVCTPFCPHEPGGGDPPEPLLLAPRCAEFAGSRVRVRGCRRRGQWGHLWAALLGFLGEYPCRD